ncbi:alpha/beta hydrolase [Kribbella albertanoniae]|nr:alpha/beta hydrolase [Kribbella albertanoniae]
MELNYRTAGAGAESEPVLLIHGGAEDADLLTPQAEAIAAQSRRVIWYDRRGTGRSPRTDWPGSGADQHADDAAELLQQVADRPAQILGFSSGGVIALALAARHPEVVAEAVAWEPPVMTVLPDGLTMHEGIMAPVEAYLTEHPADWEGACVVLLAALSDGAADPESPQVRRFLRNAEAMVRDDGQLITRREFTSHDLRAARVTIATSKATAPFLAAIAQRLATLANTEVEHVPEATDHEVYLTDPEVFARWLRPPRRTQSGRTG